MLALLLVVPSAATQYDFQNFLDRPAAQEVFPILFINDQYHPTPVFYRPLYTTQGQINQIGIVPVDIGSGNYGIRINSTGTPEEFNEISWWGYNNNVYLDLWDGSKTYMGQVSVADAALVPSGGWVVSRQTLYRNGNVWEFYVNGKKVSTEETVVGTPYYFYLTLSTASTYPIDNLIVGDSEPDIIGCMPSGWYVRRDMITPTLKGVINETGTSMSTEYFDANWMVDASGTYTISVENVATGFVANTSSWTAAADYSKGWAGNTTYTISDTFINTSAPYGYYAVRLKDGGTTLDSSYLWYLATGASIQWDRDTYSNSDTAVISWTISDAYWDTTTYSYEGRIIDLYGTEMDSWAISDKIDSENVNLAGYDTGDYYAVIVATNKATGTEYYMDYDTAIISDAVNIEGLTLNAQTGALLSGPNVNMTQTSTWWNTTASGGVYNLSDFSSGTGITIYGSKATYNFTPFVFTPASSGTYNLSLVFIPDVMGNSTSAGSGSIVGLTYEDWSHNPIPSATVRISNSTWTGTTNTTNTAGYYEFHRLAAGESYTLNATATGYEQSPDYTKTCVQSIASIQNLELTPAYILGVECRDDDTDALITADILVECSDGQTYSTSNGRAQFTLDYGAYEVTGTTDGYYVAAEDVLMTGDRNITLSFTKSTTSSGSGIAYPPHQVSFIVKNMWGKPLEGILVTAQGYETTAGAWDWLKSLLGMDLDATPIHNETMEGYTGRDGALVFMMIENVKYTMTLTNATQGVSTTYEVYPKNDFYEIWVTTGAAQWWSTGYDAMEEINITVEKVRKNSTYGFINITYLDNLAGTTGGTIYVNQTNKTATGLSDITVSSFAIPSSSFNKSFTVPADDDSYFVVFAITHSTFGNIVRVFSVIFEKVQVGIGLPTSWLVYISVFLILFTGMFFGAATSPTFGAVITCFMGWLLWSIGWLADLGAAAPIALTFATVISVLSVIMYRSRYP